MKSLFPFFALYQTHFGRLLGVVLAILGLAASIGFVQPFRLVFSCLISSSRQCAYF